MRSVAFGDYELLRKIAAGGMGEVFLARRAHDAGFERYLAIKRVLPELVQDEELVGMFLDEARLAARLEHPNIVQIYDLGVCGDQYYLAMEFLEGRDMRRILGRLGNRRRAMPVPFAAQVIAEAAAGLHYAHELTDREGRPLGIIHRDVSPQNVFITTAGTVKILDFGIAKAQTQLARTKTGFVKGKVAYLSPEQLAGTPVTRQSDIFALGTILWEATLGRRLFRRANDLLSLKAVAECDVPPPTRIARLYPPALEAVVLRALARDPAERYRTCREMQEDLHQFLLGAGHLVTAGRLGEWVRHLFDDTPLTVQDVLRQLQAPKRSQSLMNTDPEGLDAASADESFSWTGSEDFQQSNPYQKLDSLYPEEERGGATDEGASTNVENAGPIRRQFQLKPPIASVPDDDDDEGEFGGATQLDDGGLITDLPRVPSLTVPLRGPRRPTSPELEVPTEVDAPGLTEELPPLGTFQGKIPQADFDEEDDGDFDGSTHVEDESFAIDDAPPRRSFSQLVPDALDEDDDEPGGETQVEDSVPYDDLARRLSLDMMVPSAEDDEDDDTLEGATQVDAEGLLGDRPSAPEPLRPVRTALPEPVWDGDEAGEVAFEDDIQEEDVRESAPFDGAVPGADWREEDEGSKAPPIDFTNIDDRPPILSSASSRPDPAPPPRPEPAPHRPEPAPSGGLSMEDLFFDEDIRPAQPQAIIPLRPVKLDPPPAPMLQPAAPPQPVARPAPQPAPRQPAPPAPAVPRPPPQPPAQPPPQEWAPQALTRAEERWSPLPAPAQQEWSLPQPQQPSWPPPQPQQPSWPPPQDQWSPPVAVPPQWPQQAPPQEWDPEAPAQPQWPQQAPPQPQGWPQQAQQAPEWSRPSAQAAPLWGQGAQAQPWSEPVQPPPQQRAVSPTLNVARDAVIPSGPPTAPPPQVGYAPAMAPPTTAPSGGSSLLEAIKRRPALALIVLGAILAILSGAFVGLVLGLGQACAPSEAPPAQVAPPSQTAP